MSAAIHPTAVVEAGAELGTNVTVGAMAYVGADAVLHDNVTLHPKATVIGRTLLNQGVEVFPGAVHATVEVLERVLQQYDGGFVLVSHDRRLIDRVATRLIVLEQGQLREL